MVRMPVDMIRQIDAACGEDVSREAWIRKVVRVELDKLREVARTA